MKRLFSFAALAALLLFGGCKADRGTVLKVYNWSDYIDETAIDEFESWYEEQTGEKVKVIYQTFDINETMLSKIERGKEDFDVVCPSDYIIERMLKSDLLLPLSRDFGDTPNYIDANLSPYIREQFNKIDGGGKNANDYAVGYMWGTTGILYNAKYVTEEEASTWDILCNEKFRDKIFVKDSPRDVYSQIILFLHQKDIEEGRVTRDELMNYTNDEDIAAVETYMKRAKELVAGWEADFGKAQMTQELGYVNLTWSGDGVWAIKEGKEVGVDLRYVCPKEGFTVWFDGWVIPKYAKNQKAANYWINFMSRPDIVIRNVDATGYVSVSGAPEVMDEFIEEDLEPIDVSYFFGPQPTAVRLDPVLYPDKATIERSTMEHDWGEHTADLVSMWSRVKGNTMNVSTIIILAVAAIAIILLLVSRMRKSKSHRTNKYSGKNARKRR